MTSIANFFLNPRNDFCFLLAALIVGWLLAWREVVRWERNQ